MRLSDGVEWGLHCCTVLALLPTGTALPAARLAEFHGVPGPYLAKHLQALARDEVLVAEQGRRGGYRLARPASAITLLDVVLAIDGEAPAFHCEEIRRRGPAGGLPASAYPLPCTIASAMAEAEGAWRASLRARTIGDLVAGLGRSVDPRAAVKAADWFVAVLP